MKQKIDKVNLLGEINVDELIDEGTKKFKKLKEEADKQVDQMNNDDNFDFNLEKLDMFQFQDKDFREEKKRVQAILLE